MKTSIGITHGYDSDSGKMIGDDFHTERSAHMDVSTRREESPSPLTPKGRNARRGIDFRPERSAHTDVSTRREESPSPSTPEGRNTRRGIEYLVPRIFYTGDADANAAVEAREASAVVALETRARERRDTTAATASARDLWARARASQHSAEVGDARASFRASCDAIVLFSQAFGEIFESRGGSECLYVRAASPPLRVPQ